MKNTTIKKLAKPNTHLTIIDQNTTMALYLTACPNADAQVQSTIEASKQILSDHKAEIVKFDIFGSIDKYDLHMKYLENAFGQLEFPVTWVGGHGCCGCDMPGIQIQAISGIPVETISLNSRPIARVYEDGSAKHCILGNVLPDDTSASPEKQAENAFENMEKGLNLAGLNLSNVIRTWFYNKNILDWYDTFNAVRDRIFKEKKIFNGLIPASTGIGGENPAGTAIIASAIAVQPKQDAVTMHKVLSPKQNPALTYGSSFNRAVEMVTPNYRQVFISGTASIEMDGKSVHLNDVKAQIAFTLEVVEAMLATRGMGYPDVTRAIGYFKHMEDIPAFREFWGQDKPVIPVLLTKNDICRNELLFEVELDAVLKL